MVVGFGSLPAPNICAHAHKHTNFVFHILKLKCCYIVNTVLIELLKCNAVMKFLVVTVTLYLENISK